MEGSRDLESSKETCSESRELVPVAAPVDVPPTTLLAQNRALQAELRRILSQTDTVRKKNEEKRRLCQTVIQTRQQCAKTRRTARPVKAPMVGSAGVRSTSSVGQMNCSFWTCNGHSPKLSDETRRLQRVLAHVPPSFRFWFAWSAQETQSLCYATLSLAQEILSERVFAASIEDPEFQVEALRQGIEECRRVRLDSAIALEAIRGFDLDDWQKVSEKLMQQRSALECLIQWTAFVRPDRNQRPFTRDEAARLKSLAEQNALCNWEEIASQLGTNRHPAECLRYYRQHFNVPNRAWEKEEDQKILQAWQEEGMRGLRLLNMEMGRDFRVVIRRLKMLQTKKNVKRGRWSSQEDIHLLKAVLRHGMCWESVSEDVKERSAPQCRERFVYSLQPSLKRSRWADWTAEATQKLQETAEQHLQQYGKIRWALLAQDFEGLSPRDLLNKWNSLMEQKGQS